MRKFYVILLAASISAPSVYGAEQQTATLDVTNMDCAACPITVRKALESVPGVTSAKVDYRSRTAVVAFDPGKTTSEALTKATANAGFPSSMKQVD